MGQWWFGKLVRFEDEFWEDDFPFVASEAGLVLRVGTFAVPGGDCEDGGEGAAHVGGGLVAGGKGSDYGAVGVEEPPAFRVFAHLEPVAGRAGGDGAVFGVLVPRSRQNQTS